MIVAHVSMSMVVLDWLLLADLFLAYCSSRRAIITGYVIRLITAVGFMGWAVGLAIIMGYVIRLITAVGFMGWAVGLAIIMGYVIRLITAVGAKLVVIWL